MTIDQSLFLWVVAFMENEENSVSAAKKNGGWGWNKEVLLVIHHFQKAEFLKFIVKVLLVKL